MRILILQGSPHMNGSTHILVHEFTEGARSAGHEVVRIDVDRLDIHPCTGCLACGYNGPCVQDDDNYIVKNGVLDADMIVFATPLYYYGMSAQLKTAIDRFCSYDGALHRRRLKSALLTVAWNTADWTFNGLVAHYQTLVTYLGLEDCGMVLGYGCDNPRLTRASKYPEAAYKLGASL